MLYGVAPGKAVSDTPAPNSLLVNELLGQLRTSNGSAEDIFNRTRVTVARASNGEQVPAVFSALVDDFYFAPPAEREPAKTPRARQSRR